MSVCYHRHKIPADAGFFSFGDLSSVHLIYIQGEYLLGHYWDALMVLRINGL